MVHELKREHAPLMNPWNLRSGLVIPLVILGIIALGFFVYSVSTLNRGYRTELRHLDVRQGMFNIAVAAFSRITAKLHSRPWPDRFFKAGPAIETGQALFDGSYDSFVLDAPNRPMQVDIYIRVRLFDSSQVFFWRIQAVDDLLDITNRVYPLVFTYLDDKDFPTGNPPGFTSKVEEILQERKDNQPKATEMTKDLSGPSDVFDITRITGATPPGSEPPADPPVGTQDPPVRSAPAIFANDADKAAVTGEKSGNTPTGTSPAPGTGNPPSPPQVVKPGGDMDITAQGREVRLANQDGEISIRPYNFAIEQIVASIIVRVFDTDGKEVLFGDRPVFSWIRKDFGYSPAFFKGREETASVVPVSYGGANNYDPAKDLVYSFPVKKGQRVVAEMSGSNGSGYVRVSSPAFGE